MRFHRWRYGILALAVFLALPIVAEAKDCSEINDGKKEICLRWFDLDNGEPKNVAFTIPGEVDCSGTDTVKDLVECWIGEDSNKKKLQSCYGLTEDEVEFDTENEIFYFKEVPSATVECFSDKEYKTRIHVNSESKFCKLAASVAVEKRWEDVFIPYTEGTKANPWSEGKIYCPDPLVIGHSAAYDVAPGAHIDTTPEIVRRRALDACITVVTKYKDACETARSNLSGQVGTKSGEKKKEIDTKKREKIAEWVTATDCSTGDSLEGNCLKEWNAIKGLTAEQCAVSNREFVKETALKDLSAGLKGKIKGQMIANEGEEGNKKWKSGSLDAFLSAQAESEVNVSEKNEAITVMNEKIKKVGAVVSFLQKRISTLSLSNALSETKTFNVTDRLRRRSGEDGSTESELTLFQKDDDGTPRNIFDKVIRLVAQVLGSLGVLLLIVSAVMMIVSQGEETMLQKAKQTFLYTLIGLAIAFFSYTIVRFLLELLLTR